MLDLQKLVRPNIRDLNPYVSARSEVSQGDLIYLDANENPFGDSVLARYPDPYQSDLRGSWADRLEIEENQVLFGNGSDELIDMLIRTFGEPSVDSILVCPPTFGMYEVSAQINGLKVINVPLDSDYQLRVDLVLKENAKVIFIPYPAAPTGNLLRVEDIESILKNSNSIVVVDEAYIDFAKAESWSQRLDEFPNLVVLQTFSKYWGLAGCRIGMMMASSEIIEMVSKIKPPYNLNNLSAQKALEVLEREEEIKANSQKIIKEREKLKKSLEGFGFVEKVFPSEANFLWVKVEDEEVVKEKLKVNKIIVRSFAGDPGFLRISVGTEEENGRLMTVLKKSD